MLYKWYRLLIVCLALSSVTTANTLTAQTLPKQTNSIHSSSDSNQNKNKEESNPISLRISSNDSIINLIVSGVGNSPRFNEEIKNGTLYVTINTINSYPEITSQSISLPKAGLSLVTLSGSHKTFKLKI